MKRIKTHLLCLAIGALSVTQAIADTIDIKTDTSKLTYNNVKVKGTKGDQLLYVSEGGSDAQKPLAQVFRIEITGEAAFNDAEKAYASEKYPDAADAYNKALKTASKDWMKDRISLRLVDLATKTGRFDVAAAGYIALIGTNPDLAATVKPAIPENKDPKAIAAAVDQIDKALGDSKLSADKKFTLLQFELELDNALGDKKAAGAVVEQMLKNGGLDPNDPATQKQYGDLKVAVAQLALDNKDYAKAQSQIEDARASLNDSGAQSQALYIIAECKYQVALNNKATDKTVWQDIAIAYMRVVTFFNDRPIAGDALARVGACYEQIGDKDKATTTYQQVISQYGSSTAAKTAQDAITRLKAGN